MRNLSMKMFGSPIGAGPGSASERVGFPSVGWPSGCVSPASSFALSTASLAFFDASSYAFLAASTGA
jgi:hypothetical protein